MHVVVVGGGIVGLASAHALATRDVAVTVCERSNIGTTGSTPRSAGGVRSQFSTRANVLLSVRSLEVWESFSDHFGVELDFDRIGYLFLTQDPDVASEFEETVAMQSALGVPSEYLTPADAAELCPGLNTERYSGATYCPRDGIVDPHIALQGYASAVRKASVDLRTETEVTDIHRDDDGAITAVSTHDDRIPADFVVNAAGPWANRVAQMADVDLPLSLNRHQIALVDPTTPLGDDTPLVVDTDTGAYFRPEREGVALVGGYMSEYDDVQNPDLYSTDIDLDWAAAAIEQASNVSNNFGPDSRIRDGWAGLTTHTPDDNPIIEETVPGFVNAVGFSGHGFQHAPAVGEVVADLVVDGQSSVVDVSGLGSQRFEGPDTDGERNVI